MADSLLTALQGLRYDPLQTSAGIGAKTAAAIAPSLIQPGQGLGTQIGINLGSLLVTSLLGRAAVNAANEETIANQRLAAEITPLSLEDRLSRIEQVEDPLSRRSLIDYSNQLRSEEVGLAQRIQSKLAEVRATAGAELEAEAAFYETPKGQRLFESELARKEKLADAMRIGRDPVQQMREQAAFLGTEEGQQYIERMGELSAAKRKTVEEKQQETDIKEKERDMQLQRQKDLAAFKSGLTLSRETALLNLKGDEKIRVKKQLDEARAQAIQEGRDPRVEEQKILIPLKGKIEEGLLEKRDELATGRIIKSQEEIRKTQQLGREYDRLYPQLDPKVKRGLGDAVAIGNAGLRLARDIEQIGSLAGMLTVKSKFSDLAEFSEINAELKNFVYQFKVPITGLAGPLKELEDINSIIYGGTFASPQDIANRLRTIVTSIRAKAYDAGKASMLPGDKLLGQLEQNLSGEIDIGLEEIPKVGAQLQQSLSGTPSAMPTVAPTISQKEQKKQALSDELEQIRKARGAKK